MQISLNGKMIDDQQAKISVTDAGLQHGVGLFETMGVYHGRVFRLEAHLNRLLSSVRQLGLARDVNLDEYRQAVRQTIQYNHLERARLRLTVTGGSVSLLESDSSGRSSKPTVLVVAQDPTTYDPGYFEQGILAVIGPAKANPFDILAGHKTLSYWHRLMTLRQAAAVGSGEVIWLNTTNHLASGAVSNIFLVKDEQLWTPYARGEEVDRALPAPVLPGVTRAAVMDVAAVMGIPVNRKMLGVSDLLGADEVFLTNSSWLVLPVTRIEQKSIGGGQVGPMTHQIRTAVLKLVERETREGN